MRWLTFFLLIFLCLLAFLASNCKVFPMPKIGDNAPYFQALATNDQMIHLTDYQGHWVVLFFYPRAFTPHCTQETCSLRDGFSELKKMGVTILGASLDDLATQKKFLTKNQVPFLLVADTDKSITRAYGVLGLLGLYAKRKTFIINPEGKIAYIFDKVNSGNHGDEILTIIKELKK